MSGIGTNWAGPGAPDGMRGGWGNWVPMRMGVVVLLQLRP